MAKRKHGVFGYIIRFIGVILTVAVMTATCMIPSRVRAKADPMSDFIDYTYDVLLGKQPESEEFGFWYHNLKDGNTTAVGMIDMLASSEEFTSKGYSSEETITLLNQTMTGHEPGPEEIEKYGFYMDHGVSARRFLSDAAGSEEFAALCQKYDVTPGTVDELEDRDRDPELTVFVSDLFTEMYGRTANPAEYNVWTKYFREGKELAPTLEKIIYTPEYSSRNLTTDETIASLCHLMLGRDATSDEMGKYHQAMDDGMSISYVAKLISEDQSFSGRCGSLGLTPGQVTLTQPRDTNYEMTAFLNRLYTKFSGKKPTGEEMNAYVLQTSKDPSGVRTVISDMLLNEENQDLFASDDEFLSTVFEVFYGHEPEQEKITSYKIALSHGVTREHVLSVILKDPAFDAKMSEYGIDTHVEQEEPKKVVALTFDDGPYSPVTMRILDTLEQYGAHATFFVTGDRVNRYRDSIVRATNLDCQIGDHTWNHTTLTRISGDAVHKQIWDTADAIYNLIGVYPKVMRPVGGSYNATVSANVGMPMILWSIDTNDWKYKDSNHVINEVLTYVKDGDIVLMHDLYETTADAVETIVPALVDAGYTLVTISELAEYKKVQMENGKAYFSMRG